MFSKVEKGSFGGFPSVKEFWGRGSKPFKKKVCCRLGMMLLYSLTIIPKYGFLLCCTVRLWQTSTLFIIRLKTALIGFNFWAVSSRIFVFTKCMRSCWCRLPRSGAVSNLRDTQQSSEQGPGQLAVVEQGNCAKGPQEVPFNQPFCDSAIRRSQPVP